MPTAAKLVSAIFFGLLGYVLSGIAASTLPENSQIGFFREFIVFLGFMIGWFVLGPRTGGAIRIALSAGLTSAVFVYLAGLIFVSFYQMIIKSMSKFYDGPLSALEGMVGIAVERAAIILMPEFLAVVICGGLVGGILGHIAARLWR